MSRILDTLAVLLPSPGETALLTACLQAGARAREGWDRWYGARVASEEGVCGCLAATRTLLPLLAGSVARSGIPVSHEVMAYLRAAALREDLRAARYRQIASEALAALDRDGAVALVVRGAVLAATVYPQWSLRHCHDLDLLVGTDRLADAVHLLKRAGWLPLAPAHPSAGARLQHSSGLQAALHTRPFALAYYDAPLERFARGGRVFAIDGVPARAPSPEATLVHLLGHATYSPSRRNLRWVADAWHLTGGHPDLDWKEIVDRLEAYRLTLPVWVLLRFLAGMGAAVPPSVLACLEQRAAAAGWTAEDVALGGGYQGIGYDLRGLWRSPPSWRGRLRVARWVLAPSPGYLRSRFAVTSPWLVPLYYFYRPAHYVAARLVRSAEPRVEAAFSTDSSIRRLAGVPPGAGAAPGAE